jgi:hypothetical protein
MKGKKQGLFEKSREMVLRWLSLAFDEASKTFRNLRGYKAMPKLVAGLRAHDS